MEVLIPVIGCQLADFPKTSYSGARRMSTTGINNFSCSGCPRSKITRKGRHSLHDGGMHSPCRVCEFLSAHE